MGETDEIAALELEVERLAAALRKAKTDLQSAKENKAGVRPGDVVCRDGQDFLVFRVTIWGNDRPWIIGRPRKKNGEWSNTKLNLYDTWRPSEGGR